MSIDFHVHPVGEESLEQSRKYLEKIGTREAIKWYSSIDLSAEGLIEEMDRAGVNKSVILALGYNINLPLLKVSNEEVSRIVDNYSERFIGFASVCPTEMAGGSSSVTDEQVEKSIEELGRAVESLGLEGVKLLPPFQHFYPNDRSLWPLYERIEDLEIPLLTHTGGEDFPGKVKYCRPYFLDDVAKDFPEMNIVLAHMGGYPFGVWFREAMMVTDENPNVYVDLAALRPRELEGLNLLEMAISWVGSESIIFGSDWPVVFDYPMHEAVETVENLVSEEEDLKNIMSGNAEKLLK